jgi:hypothetical protein
MNPALQDCMGLSQTSASLYRVVITLFIVMPDCNPNNSQINLKLILSVLKNLFKMTEIMSFFFEELYNMARIQ